MENLKITEITPDTKFSDEMAGIVANNVRWNFVNRTDNDCHKAIKVTPVKGKEYLFRVYIVIAYPDILTEERVSVWTIASSWERACIGAVKHCKRLYPKCDMVCDISYYPTVWGEDGSGRQLSEEHHENYKVG